MTDWVRAFHQAKIIFHGETKPSAVLWFAGLQLKEAFLTKSPMIIAQKQDSGKYQVKAIWLPPTTAEGLADDMREKPESRGGPLGFDTLDLALEWGKSILHEAADELVSESRQPWVMERITEQTWYVSPYEAANQPVFEVELPGNDSIFVEQYAAALLELNEALPAEKRRDMWALVAKKWDLFLHAFWSLKVIKWHPVETVPPKDRKKYRTLADWIFPRGTFLVQETSQTLSMWFQETTLNPIPENNALLEIQGLLSYGRQSFGLLRFVTHWNGSPDRQYQFAYLLGNKGYVIMPHKEFNLYVYGTSDSQEPNVIQNFDYVEA